MKISTIFLTAVISFFTSILFAQSPLIPTPVTYVPSDAQTVDSIQNREVYEDIGFYAGWSLVKLSESAPGATLNLGFLTGYKHFKFGFGYGVSTKRGDSGIRYLSAYGLTTTESIEVPFEAETGYSYVSMDVRYYLKNTQTSTGSNFYGNVSWVTQIFSLVAENGKYDPEKYYVQDEVYNVAGVKINWGVSYGLRLATGYEYTFRSRLAFTSQLAYDFNFLDLPKSSAVTFPGVHAVMAGIGVKYTFVFSGKQ